MATWGGDVDGVFGKDSFIMQSNPDTNYGDNENLVLGRDDSGKTGILDRTLAEIDFSGAPAGLTVDTVTSAYIYMYLHTGLLLEEFGGTWHRITEAWNEVDPDGVTWNDQPTWSGTEYSAETLDFSAGWNSWDVWRSGDSKSLIKDAIANRSKILDIELTVSSYLAEAVQYAQFYSRTGPSSKPYLIITYTPPAGAASRNQGYVFGSTLGLRLPSLPRDWMRRPDLRGLVLPAAA